MRFYVIHAPLGLESVATAEGARADRAGFRAAALVFGPLWLLARRLWIAFAVYVVLGAAAVALGGAGFLNPAAVAALFVLGHLYLGFQGGALLAAARERRGLSLADVAFANSAREAEKLYIERKLRPQLARRDGPAAARASAEVIGLFPEPGR